ncbi:hypothetical protein BJV74DRAFT_850588, partial [Russula compacta]
MLAVPVMPLVVPHMEPFAPLLTFLVARWLGRLMSSCSSLPAHRGITCTYGVTPTVSTIWPNGCMRARQFLIATSGLLSTFRC